MWRYFTRATEFLCKKVGQQNIISAVVHMDEKTPHLHLTFVPLTEDGRLSAKDILGNRANLSKWQDEFHAHMAAAYPILERGQSSRETGRRHIPMRVFKQAVNLTKQAQQIEALLTDIHPLNASKKRDEAMALLHKWFPQMENFEGQLKKYRKTIDLLAEKNAALVEQVEATDENSFQRKLEAAKLQSEVRDLRRVVESIPPEWLKELKAAQKEQRRERGRER